MKETEITIKVKLDENNIPEQILWSAPDGGMKNQLSKAILLSFWDSKKKETLKMDLWTKEMPVDEMKSFVLQTFLSMKQSISKATGEENLVNLIEDFCAEFEKRISDNPK
ncbi:gliding motility protein GldC [Flavobacteriaceae bacterium]|nr:gliding motility protein GldC [Flavobacteriaceae bacterium]MDB3963788.1 gliding motility protein GldC [Flavobacteriaceae bacterium]